MRITYEIKGAQGNWSVFRNGEPGANYATAEGAFEVVAAQASLEMRSDHEIEILVRPQSPNDKSAADHS